MIQKFFDFRFKHYITPIVAGVLQYIIYLFLVLGWLNFLFSQNYYISFGVRFLMTIVLLPVSIIGVRMWLEFMVAMVKIAENSEEIKDVLKSKSESVQE